MARKVGKASTPQAVRKVKKTLTFDVETARRLGSFACHVGQTESAVVVELVRSRLQGYRSFLVDGGADEEESRPVRLADPPARESA